MLLYYLFYAYLCLITFGNSTCVNHAQGTHNKGIITNRLEIDGFGSQFQEIIAAVVCAELTNKKFVYTPFKKMEHNYDNDPNFLAKKESFINFIDNFELNKNYIDASTTMSHKAFFDKNIIRCVNSFSFKKIKKVFRANKKIERYFNNENLNIAIHVRRPNPHDTRIDGTDTPDAVFLNIINKLRIIYSSKNPLFHLYSQGNNESFKKFHAPDIVFHINESVEDTFLAMVLADVLVIGISSLSYTAGLLSNGTVYYFPFWHSPLPEWISIKQL